MKRRGYLLIYVVLILSFVSVVALYTMERMRLALLVEERRSQSIHDEVEHDSLIRFLFQEDSSKRALDILLHHINTATHIDQPSVYPMTIEYPDGSTGNADATVDIPDKAIAWSLSADTDNNKRNVIQHIVTPIDKSTADGGLSLDEKFEIFYTFFDGSEYPIIEHEGNIEIGIYDTSHFILRLYPHTADTEETEITEDPSLTELPETETIEPTVDLPETEEISDEEVSEDSLTESVDSETDAVITENSGNSAEESEEVTGPFTEDLIDSTVETESSTEAAAPGEIILPKKEPILLRVKGDVIFTASVWSEMHGIILVDGNIEWTRCRFNGILLHRGEVVKSIDSKVYGYYDTDIAVNVSKLGYYGSTPAQVYLRGSLLPGFITFPVDRFTKEAPDEFP